MNLPKNYLARRIIALAPAEFEAYCEPFLGGGSVLMNLDFAGPRYAGDADADLVNTWRVVQVRPNCLYERLKGIPYTEEEFERWKGWEPVTLPTVHEVTDAQIERAVKTLIVSRFSRGGLGKSFAESDRLRGGRMGDENAWLNFVKEVPTISEHLRRPTPVDIQRRPAANAIIEFQARHPGGWLYLDPPYLPETRTAKKAYGEHEMTIGQHVGLLEMINRSPCRIAISGYRCQACDHLLRDWTRHEFDMPNHSGQGKAKDRRVEFYLPLLHAVARRILKGAPPDLVMGDLVSMGAVGLIEAIEKYDPE